MKKREGRGGKSDILIGVKPAFSFLTLIGFGLLG